MITFFLLISLPAAILAYSIKFNTPHIYVDNEIYFLDVSFHFTLTEEALDALRHGIPLEIHTMFQLKLVRNWFWDKTISETMISYRLEHQPLTQDYLTINLQTGLRQFQNLFYSIKTFWNQTDNILVEYVVILI